MSGLFLKIVNMGISASWLVPVALLLRLAFQKAPKWVNVLLWAVVALRLVCPVSIESNLSLMPRTEWIEQEAVQIAELPVPDTIVSGAAAGESVTITDTQNTPEMAVNRGLSAPFLLSCIWLAGAAALLLYTAVSYILLRRRVAAAVRLRENIFQSESAGSPFVLGILRPKIYVPYQMDDQALEYVVSHERAHIRRRDHWWKPLGFLLLTVHWFNPLMWLAYALFCRDMELACDEKVIRELDSGQRADYTQALLGCSISRRVISACPLAFGEVGVKERVRSVMNYKKPAFWVMVLAVAACVVVAVCFLTDPKNQNPDTLPLLYSHSYSVAEVVYETAGTSFSMAAQQNTPVYAVTENLRLMSKGEHAAADEWTTLGALTGTELTRENFDELFFSKGHWFTGESAANIRRDTANVWRVVYDESVLYYVLQQKNGEVYLAQGYYDHSEQDDPGSDDTNIQWLFKLAYDLTEDTGIVAASGSHVVPVVGFPSGTPVADMKASVHWLDITFGTNGYVPFEIIRDGKEQYGWYEIYDGETMEPLQVIRPSGLPPQTYLFQNAEYGRDYLVTLQLGGEELLCFGARMGDAFHGQMLCVKMEELDPGEPQEAKYNFFDVTPFDGVTLPGVNTAVFSIEEVGNFVQIAFETPLYQDGYETHGLQMKPGESLRLTTAKAGGTAYTFSFMDEEKAGMYTPDGAAMVLDDAISKAILDHYSSDKPDGLIHVESHALLADETISGTAGQSMGRTTVYLHVLQQKYSTYGGKLEEKSGSYVPTAITFKISDSGGYILEEYWEPRDGIYYAEDIREKFPGASAEEALNSQAYVDDLSARCYNQALAYLNKTGGLEVRETLIKLTRADREGFCVRNTEQICRHTLCISKICEVIYGGK